MRNQKKALKWMAKHPLTHNEAVQQTQQLKAKLTGWLKTMQKEEKAKNTIVMTQEEKQLLLKDLCARLPYKVKVEAVPYVDPQILCSIDPIRKEFRLDFGKYRNIFETNWVGEEYSIVKPYLRSMSSMTEEEKEEYNACAGYGNYEEIMTDRLEFLNERHFDYRGLINLGLAIEAPKGMYKTK